MSVAPVQDKLVADEVVPEALKVGAVGAVVFFKTMSRNIQVPKCLYDSNTLDYSQKMTLERMMGEIHDTLIKAKEGTYWQLVKTVIQKLIHTKLNVLKK